MTLETLATRPQPGSGILDIAPYIPGKSGAGAKVFKLSSNESALGASPAAIAAYLASAKTLALYPDGAATPLREAIAGRYGLAANSIVCGSGSDELLQLLSHAYLRPGDEAIYSRHGFLVYPIAINANGATPVIAAERNYTADVDAILQCVTARTRMVFLANPNNPTGTYLPISEVKRLQAGLPKCVLLVLDAAYAEFVRREDYESGLELVAAFENVVMTRTFSKVYGLAALRLGWVYCPAHIADVLNRIRGPFNVSAPAIAAGTAAIGDQSFVDQAVAHNDYWIAWLTRELFALGVTVTPSACNFLLLHFASARITESVDAYLISHGLILRRMEPYGLPDALRLTVGSEEANRALIAALRNFLA